MDRDSQRIYFPHLDVVRFYAAFMIIILHAYESWVGWFGKHYLEQEAGFADRLLRNLGIGVDVFFLISGFLITTLLLREKEITRGIHVFKFILRRTFRIWPLYFFLIALAPLLVNWMETDQPDYLSHALFIGNFSTIGTESWSYPFAHFWSICIEEQYYLAWPFLLAIIPSRKLIYLFVALIGISISYRLYLTFVNSQPWYHLYLHTFSRMDALVIGALGAWFYVRRPFRFNIPRIYGVLVLVLLLIYLSYDPVNQWDSRFAAGFKKYFYLIPIAFLMVNYNFNDRIRHLFRPKSYMHYLGKVSYGVYMYHNILILIVVKEVMWEYGTSSAYIFFPVIILGTILISVLSYELMEKPFLRIARRFRVVDSDR